jgi:S1-C subfamily serine protease
VERSGPFNFGDFADDPDDAAGEDDDHQAALLPPEDRLWRHPSEVARHGHPQGVAATTTVPGRSSRRDHRFAVTAGAAGAVGAVAVATVVVVGFMLPSSSEVTSSPRTVPTAREATFVTVPVAAVTAPLVVRMMDVLRPSLVAISGPGKGRSGPMTGIVLPGGDLAVTAATAVGTAKRVEIVTASGQKRRVKVLGSDPHSGIAVVSTGGGLTAASFTDGVVAPGELAVAACLCGTAVATAADTDPPAAAVGEVRKVGTGATMAGGSGLVDAIEADMPLGRAPWGGVLLNGQGQVVGVLDAREKGSSSDVGLFVPASLAVAVAQELATTHQVAHGWLGIKCTDAPGQSGARITAIMTGSPAASAGLHLGDVVEKVDAQPIESLADLQATLYTTPPGTSVNVMLLRSGQDMTTTLTLAGSPTG